MHRLFSARRAAFGGVVVALAILSGTAVASSGASRAATPHKGGTLNLVGQGDVDHLDTSSIYSGVTYTIERAFTRQLVTYPATGTTSMPANLVPDIATTVPTVANGGVTNGGKTYTYHLKSGVKWNTSPARQVTASDVVRGIELLCNPASPTGAPGYYESTIVGMQGWCKAFLAVKPTVAAIDAFIAGHKLAGVQATNASTVVFHLIRAASDFNDIVSLPFSSPAPIEYLKHVPDSADFRAHTISDGPYQITTYKPNNQIVLDRNPAWVASTDKVRHAWVDKIVVTEGQTSQSVQQQLQAGTADMEWDTNVPPQSLPALKAKKDPNLDIYQSGSLDPYMVINFQSPNANRATSKLGVRQAVEYAIDKAGIIQVNGGSLLNAPLNQVITPGNAGYQKFDLYPSAGSRGNPAKAKQLLAKAGYPKGVSLKLLYDDADPDPQIAQVIQSSLAKAGIKVVLKQVPQNDLYGNYLVTPAQAKQGVWDLAIADWGPDWFGNNGRTTIQPLLDGSTYGPGSSDYGDYSSSAETAFINKALAASSPAASNAAWHAADLLAMKDAAIVPIDVHEHAVYHASSVHGWFIDPYSRVGDVTDVWLS
ncbi:MAG TPA: ABC transporter substrate-binding protein [Gaiellaceae bacterium]|jgi:peptide/nickel transport system substrate-binding protein|nr:ABC transporter substrate-binding protein [Gaiellaceae bacterium]